MSQTLLCANNPTMQCRAFDRYENYSATVHLSVMVQNYDNWDKCTAHCELLRTRSTAAFDLMHPAPDGWCIYQTDTPSRSHATVSFAGKILRLQRPGRKHTAKGIYKSHKKGCSGENKPALNTDLFVTKN